MNRALFTLGFLWALPITLLAFVFYVGPCWLMGWYKLEGWKQLAWFWCFDDSRAPKWLQRKWARHASAVVGSLIIMKPYPEGSHHARIITLHELTHVRQTMILGVLQPLCYAINWLCGTILKNTMGNVDGYYDSLFEIHARREAGQIVDIVGLTKKLREPRNKHP